MRIKSIHLFDVGPHRGHREFNLGDNWQGGTNHLVLFSGPNGTGKSTVLRAIAYLWQMAGQWLATPAVRPTGRSEARTWLRNNAAAVAILVDDVPGIGKTVGIYFGDEYLFSSIQPQAHFWMGELSGPHRPASKSYLMHHDSSQWMWAWSQAYKVLILSFEPSDPNGLPTPNLIYLDGEERRWVRPKGDPGKPIPDDPTKRWLVTYLPSEDWSGQLEASLVTLKTLDEPSYLKVLTDLNAFLVGKFIRPQPTPALRLLVDVQDAQGTHNHPLDDLSAGERQVLMQLYLVSRWLQTGGVVLLDEPDLHLHPSLVDPFVARLKALVAERNGQLFLTSHSPMLWDYCEARGLRIKLGQGGEL